MILTRCKEQAPFLAPAHYRVQARRKPALQSDAHTLVRSQHLAALCRLAVAAQQVGRPDLIRSPKRVLDHCWEGLDG